MKKPTKFLPFLLVTVLHMCVECISAEAEVQIQENLLVCKCLITFSLVFAIFRGVLWSTFRLNSSMINFRVVVIFSFVSKTYLTFFSIAKIFEYICNFNLLAKHDILILNS